MKHELNLQPLSGPNYDDSNAQTSNPEHQPIIVEPIQETVVAEPLKPVTLMSSTAAMMPLAPPAIPKTEITKAPTQSENHEFKFNPVHVAIVGLTGGLLFFAAVFIDAVTSLLLMIAAIYLFGKYFSIKRTGLALVLACALGNLISTIDERLHANNRVSPLILPDSLDTFSALEFAIIGSCAVAMLCMVLYILRNLRSDVLRWGSILVFRCIIMVLLSGSYMIADTIVHINETKAHAQEEAKILAQPDPKRLLDLFLVDKTNLIDGRIFINGNSNDSIDYDSYFFKLRNADSKDITISGMVLPKDFSPTDNCRASDMLLTTNQRCEYKGLTKGGNPYYAIVTQSAMNRSSRQINPEDYFVTKNNTLVRISGLADKPTEPLHPDRLPTLMNTLFIPQGKAEDAFYAKYADKTPKKFIKIQKAAIPPRPSAARAFVALIWILYLAILLWAVECIFVKARRRRSFVYVPILNIWVLSNIAGKPGWWSLLYLAPAMYSMTFLFGTIAIFALPIVVPLLVILPLVILVMYILVALGLADTFNRSKRFALLLILPPWPGLLMLGFGEAFHNSNNPYALSQRGSSDQI